MGRYSLRHERLGDSLRQEDQGTACQGSGSRKALWGIAFWVGLVFSLWNWSDRLPFATEVTVYHGFCPKPRVNSVCEQGEEAANPTTYKALVDQQAIVYWTGGSAPSKLERCAIRDAHNWSCRLGTRRADDVDEIKWILNDGDFSETVDPLGVRVASIFYQVPKWRWWLLNWGIN